MLPWVGKGFREEDLRALGRRRVPHAPHVVLQSQVPPVAPPTRVRGGPKRFVCRVFSFDASLISRCSRHRKLDIVTGTNVAKRWKSENQTFEGRVVGVHDDNDVRVIDVAYADGDHVLHREDDESWDVGDWAVLSHEPQHDGSIWTNSTTAQLEFVNKRCFSDRFLQSLHFVHFCGSIRGGLGGCHPCHDDTHSVSWCIPNHSPNAHTYMSFVHPCEEL